MRLPTLSICKDCCVTPTIAFEDPAELYMNMYSHLIIAVSPGSQNNITEKLGMDLGTRSNHTVKY